MMLLTSVTQFLVSLLLLGKQTHQELGHTGKKHHTTTLQPTTYYKQKQTHQELGHTGKMHHTTTLQPTTYYKQKQTHQELGHTGKMQDAAASCKPDT